MSKFGNEKRKRRRENLEEEKRKAFLRNPTFLASKVLFDFLWLMMDPLILARIYLDNPGYPPFSMFRIPNVGTRNLSFTYKHSTFWICSSDEALIKMFSPPKTTNTPSSTITSLTTTTTTSTTAPLGKAGSSAGVLKPGRKRFPTSTDRSRLCTYIKPFQKPYYYMCCCPFLSWQR